MAGAVTTTLRLGTSVTLIGQRDPIWTAKQVASLDHLTGGRVELGIGFGWNREEQENHGFPWADRRAMVREKVLAMQALWTQDEASVPRRARAASSRRGRCRSRCSGRTRRSTSAADGGRSCSPPSSSTATAGCRSRPARRWPAAHRPAASGGRGEPGATRHAIAVSVFGATTDPAGLAQLAGEGVTRAVLTLPYEDVDVVLPLLDEWAPAGRALSRDLRRGAPMPSPGPFGKQSWFQVAYLVDDLDVAIERWTSAVRGRPVRGHRAPPHGRVHVPRAPIRRPTCPTRSATSAT